LFQPAKEIESIALEVQENGDEDTAKDDMVDTVKQIIPVLTESQFNINCKLNTENNFDVTVNTFAEVRSNPLMAIK
jgi:hypothetical protein